MTFAQHLEHERLARAAWCATRTVGDHTATFTAGDTIRCPGTRMLDHAAVVCGAPHGRLKKYSHLTATFRVLGWNEQPQSNMPGIDDFCRKCNTLHEV
ncbi:MAG TPA: hypothetical protein VGP44_10780, partial [Gemmatimonadales bacterium]|nr:hypothetical protein [Gemmatimonadales bacterium]